MIRSASIFLIFLIIIFSPIRHQCAAQHAIPDSFQRSLQDAQTDTARVDSVNKWIWGMRLSNAPLGIRLGAYSIDLAREIDYDYGLAVALESQGVLYDMIGAYQKAVENYFEALEIWEEFDDPYYLMSGYINLAVLFDRWGDTTKALRYFEEVIALDSTVGDGSTIPLVLNNLATMYSDRGQYEQAKEYYLEALHAFKALAGKGEEEYTVQLATLENNLGNYYRRKGDLERAMEYYRRGLEKSQSGAHNKIISSSYLGLSRVYKERKQFDKALEFAMASLDYARRSGNTERVSFAYELLRDVYAAMGDYESAFAMDTNFLRTREKINELSQQALVRELEARYQNEKQQLEIENQSLILDEKNARLAEQKTALISAGGGLVLLLLLVGVVYNRYQIKRRSHKELSEKNRMIEKEKQRSDELLLNILPEETAQELKERGKAAARRYDEVTVLFTDFENFSLISQELSPDELVADLDELFRAFDEITDARGMEKIKTIGDAYMAAAGIPTPCTDHAKRVVAAALDIQRYLDGINQERTAEGKHQFRARCGIHTGPVVAGIVGSKKFAYDIWGDTVNTAARMESAGVPGKVNVSESTYERVRDEYECTYRGEIEAKNKGAIDMYFVTG